MRRKGTACYINMKILKSYMLKYVYKSFKCINVFGKQKVQTPFIKKMQP